MYLVIEENTRIMMMVFLVAVSLAQPTTLLLDLGQPRRVDVL